MKYKILLLILLFGTVLGTVARSGNMHIKVGAIKRTATTAVSGAANEFDVTYDSTSPTKPTVTIYLDTVNHGTISGTGLKRMSVGAGNHTLKLVWSDNTTTNTYYVANSFTVFITHN